jgi:hypothetical protein
VLLNENTSSEDCAGREGAAKAPPDCGEDWAGVEVAMPIEKNVFPCALVPAVVMRILGEAGMMTAQKPRQSIAPICWMTLQKMEQELLG